MIGAKVTVAQGGTSASLAHLERALVQFKGSYAFFQTEQGGIPLGAAVTDPDGRPLKAVWTQGCGRYRCAESRPRHPIRGEINIGSCLAEGGFSQQG